MPKKPVDPSKFMLSLNSNDFQPLQCDYGDCSKYVTWTDHKNDQPVDLTEFFNPDKLNYPCTSVEDLVVRSGMNEKPQAKILPFKKRIKKPVLKLVHNNPFVVRSEQINKLSVVEKKVWSPIINISMSKKVEELKYKKAVERQKLNRQRVVKVEFLTISNFYRVTTADKQKHIFSVQQGQEMFKLAIIVEE